MVAEALFPAAVHRVEQAEEDDANGRQLDKFVAYVSRHDEAKAIGAGGVNVKLAAALTGCFILIERHEENQGGWGETRVNSRGGDTRNTTGGWTAAGGRGWDEPVGGGWGEEDGSGGWNDEREAEDPLTPLAQNSSNQRRGPVNIDPNSMDFLDPETFGVAAPSSRKSENQSRFGDLIGGNDGDKGVDYLGWPDLESSASQSSAATDDLGWPDLDPLAPLESGIDDSLEEYLAGTPPPDEDESTSASDALDPRDDSSNWEEVGPGKAGVVTFGASGAGVGGAATFMGDDGGAGGDFDDGFEEDDAAVSWQ